MGALVYFLWGCDAVPLFTGHAQRSSPLIFYLQIRFQQPGAIVQRLHRYVLLMRCAPRSLFARGLRFRRSVVVTRSVTSPQAPTALP